VSAPPTYTDQQVADAKAKVCAAFQLAHQAVLASSARALPTDPTSNIAFATAGRQAIDVGSRYIALVLAEEPATPGDVREAATNVIRTYQVATINYLAEVSQPELDNALHASDGATLAIQNICK
jgi:hypothetical protein